MVEKLRFRCEDNVSRMGSCGLDSNRSGHGPVADFCELDTEPSGFIKGGEFLDYLSECRLIKKDSDPGNFTASPGSKYRTF